MSMEKAFCHKLSGFEKSGILSKSVFVGEGGGWVKLLIHAWSSDVIQ